VLDNPRRKVDQFICRRLCYMNGEKQLNFFKKYNRINCEHECLSLMTLNSCHCVQFHMARNQSTNVCGSLDKKCFKQIEEKFPLIKKYCKCYEPCETIKYLVDVYRDPAVS
jgi:hypothetical protein